MGKEPGHGLARPQMGGWALYRAFGVVFAAVFFAAVLLAVAPPWGLAFARLKLFSLALGAAAALAVSRLVLRLPVFPKSVQALVAIVLFCALAAVQYYVGMALMPAPDGFGPVFSAAENYALNGTRAGTYFLLYPADAGLFTLLYAYFSALHLLGVTGFALPMLILNMVSVNVGLLLVYFCAHKVFGPKKALFSLIICLVNTLFLPFMSTCSAELLALPFVAGMVLLWIKARVRWRGGRFGRALVLFCLFSLLGALGALLKTAVWVVWLAAALDLLVLLRGKGRLLLLPAGAAVLVLLYFGGGWLIRGAQAMPVPAVGQAMPKTAGILIGLKSEGNFEETAAVGGEVYAQLEALGGQAARVAYTTEAIFNELSARGPLGVLLYVGAKLGYAFGGAAQYAGMKVPVLLGAEAWYTPVYFVVLALNMALIFWLAMGAVKAVYRKNSALSFIRVALFGVLILQVVWEADVRYMLCFWPLLVLGALEAAPPPPAWVRQAAGKAVTPVPGDANAPLETIAAVPPNATPPAPDAEKPVTAQTEPAVEQAEPAVEQTESVAVQAEPALPQEETASPEEEAALPQGQAPAAQNGDAAGNLTET